MGRAPSDANVVATLIAMGTASPIKNNAMRGALFFAPLISSATAGESADHHAAEQPYDRERRDLHQFLDRENPSKNPASAPMTMGSKNLTHATKRLSTLPNA